MISIDCLAIKQTARATQQKETKEKKYDEKQEHE